MKDHCQKAITLSTAWAPFHVNTIFLIGVTHFNKIFIIRWPIWDRCPYFNDLILYILGIEYGSLC